MARKAGQPVDSGGDTQGRTHLGPMARDAGRLCTARSRSNGLLPIEARRHGLRPLIRHLMRAVACAS